MIRTRVHNAMMADRGRSLGADGLVLLALALWWVLNLLQASFMDLANDEAYYWYFSKHLDWGYYDHPPLVAVLIWLTSWIPGPLGVRFAATLLQPLYLLLFWRLIRPADASRRDAVLYVLICFSQPLLQLYGFLAVPDAPLLMSTALFLGAYKRFCHKTDLVGALLLGVTVALMGYSKYHGALVVLLVVLSNPKLLLRWQLWLAAVVAVILYAPHLWWQYSHDWVSFRYHLLERNADGYSLGYTLEYLGMALVIFNPLWLRLYSDAYFLMHRRSDFDRALLSLLFGFLVFFLISTLRGPVQPQWLLPAVFPIVAMGFYAGRRSRYLHVAGWLCMGLFLMVRLLSATNLIHINGEMWDQHRLYKSVADTAQGRPVVFMHTYTAPAKYIFYTGGEAYCAPYYFNRHSQWQYDTSDRTYTGREVMVCNFTNRQVNKLPLGYGGYRQLYYEFVTDYRPVRELSASFAPLNLSLPLQPDTGGAMALLPLDLTVTNPYPYDLYSTDSVPLIVNIYFAVKRYVYPASGIILGDTLRAGATTSLHCIFGLPASLPDGTYPMGVCIGPKGVRLSDTGPRRRVHVARTSDSLILETR